MESQKNTEREQKHVDLYRAIKDVSGISDHIEHLLEKINGPIPKAEENEPVSTGPTLAQILSEGAEEIRRYSDKAHRLLDEIEGLLF